MSQAAMLSSEYRNPQARTLDELLRSFSGKHSANLREGHIQPDERGRLWLRMKTYAIDTDALRDARDAAESGSDEVPRFQGEQSISLALRTLLRRYAPARNVGSKLLGLDMPPPGGETSIPLRSTSHAGVAHEINGAIERYIREELSGKPEGELTMTQKRMKDAFGIRRNGGDGYEYLGFNWRPYRPEEHVDVGNRVGVFCAERRTLAGAPRPAPRAKRRVTGAAAFALAAAAWFGALNAPVEQRPVAPPAVEREATVATPAPRYALDRSSKIQPEQPSPPARTAEPEVRLPELTAQPVPAAPAWRSLTSADVVKAGGRGLTGIRELYAAHGRDLDLGTLAGWAGVDLAAEDAARERGRIAGAYVGDGVNDLLTKEQAARIHGRALEPAKPPGEPLPGTESRQDESLVRLAGTDLPGAVLLAVFSGGVFARRRKGRTIDGVVERAYLSGQQRTQLAGASPYLAMTQDELRRFYHEHKERLAGKVEGYDAMDRSRQGAVKTNVYNALQRAARRDRAETASLLAQHIGSSAAAKRRIAAQLGVSASTVGRYLRERRARKAA